MDPPDPDDYERIKPLKKGKPYSYKCRYCGAPAAWKESLPVRDRWRRVSQKRVVLLTMPQ